MGQNLIYLPSCHSTNALALEMLAAEPLPEGTLIITTHQTAGRGQRGNTWEAAPGQNLTFSLVLCPNFLPLAEVFALNIITALAVAEAVERVISPIAPALAAEVQVKWANDILCKRQKIAGILIENQLRQQQLETSVVGIGVNVNQERFAAPQAASLASLTAQYFDLQDVLNEVLQHVEKYYLQLRHGRGAALKQSYLEKMFWYNTRGDFEIAGKAVEGYIRGIDQAGHLELCVAGELRSFDLKEIKFLY